MPVNPTSPTPPSSPPRSTFTATEPNEFGIYAVYKELPERQPTTLGDDSACDSATFNVTPDAPRDILSGFGSDALKEQPDGSFGPFKNWTVFSLLRWAYDTTIVTGAALNRLVREVIRQPQFDLDHLDGFNAHAEMKKMDDFLSPDDDETDPERPRDEWREGTIRLAMPKATCRAPEDEAPFFEIPGVQYRDLLEVTKAAFRDPNVSEMNMKGHVLMVDAGDGSDRAERVHGEAYTANAVLEFEEEVRNRPEAATCHLETVVAVWILYSDSTHLASFGTASIWPVYGWIANFSKYLRAKSSKLLAHHLAYLPKLPDAVYDAYRQAYGCNPTKAVIAQLRRDLFHAVWELILTPELAEAYCHGHAMACGDGVRRRLFIRFLLKSMDYPEKMLTAAIRTMTEHICPRCNTPKDKLHLMGTKQDRTRREKLERKDSSTRRSLVQRARDWMFRLGRSIKHTAIRAKLSFGSAPLLSAFSNFLFPFGINYYSLLAVDLLHEFELGVWKSLFIHLVRMCVCFGPATVRTLDERYRALRPFGRSVIRRFRNNVSELKGFAGRDFEDLLQCALPVFEGLFPEPFNTLTLDLIGWMSTWHAYAKMRIHTDSTLRSFDIATTALGKTARRFSNETSELQTRALVKETRAKQRRKTSKASKSGAQSAVGKQRLHAAPVDDGNVDDAPLTYWNLNTVKFHFLGYYVSSIPRFGTTDSHNSELGEAEHRRLKRFYARTNHNRPDSQIGRHVRRERLLRAIDNQANDSDPLRAGMARATARRSLILTDSAIEPLPKTNPHDRYQSSRSTRYPEDLTRWVSGNAGDPAVEEFVPKLKNHILARILGGDEEEDFDEADRDSLHIINNTIYKHKTVRFNYTTYDMRRKQDSCNPRTQADIMVLNPSDDKHIRPYWFCRITGIIHLRVLHTGPHAKSRAIQTFDVLTVRYFGHDDRQKKFGLHVNRNPRIGFLPADDPDAFGFVDPAAVLRACYIVPAFHYGYHDNGLGRSVGRPRQEVDDERQPDMDWAYYYVVMYADRDMVMRFRGDGIGHVSTRKATRGFAEQNFVPLEQEEVEDSELEGSDVEDMDVDVEPAPGRVDSDDEGGSPAALEDDSDGDGDGDDGDGEDGDGDSDSEREGGSSGSLSDSPSGSESEEERQDGEEAESEDEDEYF
ncbi:hypothetical protein C8F01DRAFT_995281 [Mycena amicta]|nr:hypothetical protein C8F01DRAFT_995281 [Mycena amicta]